MKRRIITSGVMLAMAGIMLGSCQKEDGAKTEVPAANNESAAHNKLTIAAVNSTWNIDWNNKTNGATYTSSQANGDFGNVSGWNDSRAYTTNGKDGTVGSRVTLLPGQLSGAGGLVANSVIQAGAAYEMDYDVKFHSQFNWSRGGKVGFGFGIGEHNTGGDAAWDGNGGTLRLMWYSPDSNPGRVYFQPYLYYKDMNGGPSSGNNFGDTFGKTYPTTGALVKGQWYHVHLYIKSNTGSNTDGHVQIVIDGNIILDQNIRWTTNDSKRMIDQLTFHTFRGGSQSYWTANTTDYIYYDNLKVHRIN
ncbi:polysaccharide lyase [Mucilaginibacter aquariorum]|uniref:Polysaccharide lyase n=1 Tax=Mucilaginibacter aquariorum TaxID=2967225 RepID=A0ABT1T4P2_9SPHI|nr:polysaccharide lyase [Mucilaginibacter aquariorum]MCQ6959565.1 polysaccharide lyase [Mucilaginibacter aquariorum]